MLLKQKHAPRSLVATCLVIPVTWALGLVNVISVLQHDQVLLNTFDTQQEQQQRQYLDLVQFCHTSSHWAHLRCLVGAQKQLYAKPWWPLASITWTAITAHKSDFGLAAAVSLPQLLLLLLAAGVVLGWSARKAAEQSPSKDAATAGSVPGTQPAASGSAAGSSSVMHFLRDPDTQGAAVFAVAKLLPMACSVLVVLVGWFGLRQPHPTSPALQLLHPLTAVLAGAVTMLCQVG